MKKTPIGEIPVEWEIHRGEDLSVLITKGESPHWQGFGYEDHGALFVTSENVRDGFLDISQPKYISDKFHVKLGRCQLEQGDVLINLVGASIGRCCLFKTPSELSANINQAVCLFRPMKDVSGTWLVAYLQASQSQRRLLGEQGDSARANLSLEDIRSFFFAIPPKDEQLAILSVLSSWDRLIEQTTSLVVAKRQLKSGLMQSFLPAKVVFRSSEKAARMVPMDGRHIISGTYSMSGLRLVVVIFLSSRSRATAAS